MPWEINLLDDVTQWYKELLRHDPATAELVGGALDVLEEHGPALGRPLVDTVTGSKLPNLKELRPGSSGNSEIRLLFAFDPGREAAVLVAGDKAGNWKSWYDENIPIAEARFAAWIKNKEGT